MKRYRVVVLPNHWREYLASMPEKAMGGFQTGHIYLHSGAKYFGAFANSTYLHYIEGQTAIPFGYEDIAEIDANNLDIDFRAYAESLDNSKWGRLIDVTDSDPEPQNIE